MGRGKLQKFKKIGNGYVLLNKENKNRNDNEENPYLLKTYYEGEIEISPLFKA